MACPDGTYRCAVLTSTAPLAHHRQVLEVRADVAVPGQGGLREDEVLVRVEAAALNAADHKGMAGFYQRTQVGGDSRLHLPRCTVWLASSDTPLCSMQRRTACA